MHLFSRQSHLFWQLCCNNAGRTAPEAKIKRSQNCLYVIRAAEEEWCDVLTRVDTFAFVLFTEIALWSGKNFVEGMDEALQGIRFRHTLWSEKLICQIQLYSDGIKQLVVTRMDTPKPGWTPDVVYTTEILSFLPNRNIISNGKGRLK